MSRLQNRGLAMIGWLLPIYWVTMSLVLSVRSLTCALASPDQGLVARLRHYRANGPLARSRKSGVRPGRVECAVPGTFSGIRTGSLGAGSIGVGVGLGTTTGLGIVSGMSIGSEPG
jgi:hypothetical protein